MGLQTTMYGDRLQIVLLGKTNAGKSSLINEITGQPLAIVSDTKGTTTDPVSKAMEILPVGPCLLTDTPGLDDEGELGRKRVEKYFRHEYMMEKYRKLYREVEEIGRNRI